MRHLLPLLEGQSVADWRTDFLCEFLAVPGTIPRWEGVRDTDWTYARYYVDGADKPPFEFLYDLKNDPNQLTNLASNTRDGSTLKKLRARCDELIVDVGPPMKEIEETPRRSRKKKSPDK